jgi:hypothetical protein
MLLNTFLNYFSQFSATNADLKARHNFVVYIGKGSFPFKTGLRITLCFVFLLEIILFFIPISRKVKVAFILKILIETPLISMFVESMARLYSAFSYEFSKRELQK